MLKRQGRNEEVLAHQVSVKLKDPDTDIHAVVGGAIATATVVRRMRGGRWNIVELPDELGVEEAIKRLKQSPAVELVEPIELYSLDAIPPDDSDYGMQWALTMINAEPGWSITTGSPRVLVGVLDTGISLSGSAVDHPDLDPSRFVLGSDYVDDDSLPELLSDAPPASPSATEPPSGGATHGNLVVGTIAARSDNATGIAGLNWSSPVYVAKVFGWYYKSWDDAGTTKSQWSVKINGGDLAAAIEDATEYAATQRLRLVLNFSGKSPGGGGLVESAVQYLREHDGILCAASGNGSSNDATPPVHAGVAFPARLAAVYDNVIAVGATDRTDAVADFSNSGPELTVVAPGVKIRTLTRTGYSNATGTSLASPITAALASLILSRNPNLSAKEVRRIIVDSAVKLDPNEDFNQLWGHGRIDVGAALAATPGLDDAGGSMGNFVVVEDGEKGVLQNAPRTYSFKVPNDVDATAPTVLQYMIRHHGVSDLDVRVTMNGGYWEQKNNLQGSEWRTFHHVLKAGAVKKGQNTMTFEIKGGSGDFRVGDVVLMFRQK